MSWLDGVRATVRGWLLRGREDRELREEMSYHLERAAERNVGAGMTAEEGRRSAHLQFGATDRFHEEVRDARGARLADDLARDVGYALRSLRRTPGFAAVALLTIALGVGAPTAIFSVVSAVVLRPLPFGNAEGLTAVWGRFLPESGFDFPQFPLSGPEYFDYKTATRALEDVAAYRPGGVTLVRNGELPQRITGVFAAANLFSVLGVSPALGRFYTDAEDTPGGPAVAVLGHTLWQSTFGGDATIIGRTVRLGGVATEIIGVMPRGVAFPATERQIYQPLRLDPADPGGRSSHGLSAVGVRASGATIEDARRELDVLMARWKAEYPEIHTGHFLIVHPFIDDVVGGARPVLLVLLGAVGFVLLIACANVANLLLARGEVRGREIAVRGALGAGRGRMIRQLLTESAVLAVAGGLAGIAIAWLAIGPLLALGEGSIPRAEGVRVDARVLGFALGLTALCSLLFGVVPALRAGRTTPVEALRGAGRITAGRRQVRLRATLVTTQVALAFLLVTGATLMIRSYRALTRVDPGVDTAGLLMADVSLPAADYPETERVVAFTDALLARLRALPGVTAASATSALPLFETPGNVDFEIEGVAPPAPGQPAHSGDAVVVAPDYARTMAIDVVEGRFFEDADRADALPVVVVNETLAHMFFPGASPLGRRIRSHDEAPWFTIVGVVGDVHYASLDAAMRPGYYLPVSQVALAFGEPARGLTFVVRTAGDPMRSANAVREAVRRSDPTIPITRLATMEDVVGDSVARPRFLTTLLALFGGLAATLGAIGLYGVLAYTVAQRGREHAIRMAVGASRSAIFAGVLRAGLALATVGVAAGIAAALGGVRVLESQLYGIAPRDTATFVTVAGGLLFVALIASGLPALRAMQVAPLDALRQD